MSNKLSLLVLSLSMLCSCTPKNQATKTETPVGVESNHDFFLLAGTYTSGTSKGIHVYRFNQADASFLFVNETEVSNPSFLAVSNDEKYVYSVSENDGGKASANAFAFNKQDGTLKLLNSQPVEGDAPCYINVDKERKFVFTANYTGGDISVLPVSEDGSLKPQSESISFSPISHLHSVVFSPDNKYLFACDLGIDRIYKFILNYDTQNGTSKLLITDGATVLKSGSGPRHLTFHPNGKFAYVINELSGKVVAMRYAGGNLEPFQYIASDTTPGIGKKGSADIHFSPDGRFLYTSNRLKSDGIAIFSVNDQTGELTSAGYQPTGIHPRNFLITPNGKYLIVANQHSNSIQIFEINKETGLLTNTGKEISVDKACFLTLVPVV